MDKTLYELLLFFLQLLYLAPGWCVVYISSRRRPKSVRNIPARKRFLHFSFLCNGWSLVQQRNRQIENMLLFLSYHHRLQTAVLLIVEQQQK